MAPRLVTQARFGGLFCALRFAGQNVIVLLGERVSCERASSGGGGVIVLASGRASGRVVLL